LYEMHGAAMKIIVQYLCALKMNVAMSDQTEQRWSDRLLMEVQIILHSYKYN